MQLMQQAQRPDVDAEMRPRPMYQLCGNHLCLTDSYKGTVESGSFWGYENIDLCM